MTPLSIPPPNAEKQWSVAGGRRMSEKLLEGVLAESQRPTVRVGQVRPEPVPQPFPQSRSAIRQRPSEALDSTTHSLKSVLFFTNALPLLSAALSSSLLVVVFTPLGLLESKLGVNKVSASFFACMLIFQVFLRLLRRAERRLRSSFFLSFPVMIGVQAAILYLCGGDAGVWAAPLNILAHTSSLTAIWFFDPPAARGNVLKYCFKRIPVAFIVVMLASVPSYSIAIPARLLRESPNWYLAWCGIGFPFFVSFALRAIGMSFFSKFLSKKVEEGKMTVHEMSSQMSIISFTIRTALDFGNFVLMYLSSSLGYATTGAVFSIGVELVTKCVLVELRQLAVKQLAKEVVKANLQKVQAVRGAARNKLVVSGAFSPTVAKLSRSKKIKELQKKGTEEAVAKVELVAGAETAAEVRAEIKSETKRASERAVAIEVGGSSEGVEKVEDAQDVGVSTGKNGSTLDEQLEDMRALFAMRWYYDMMAGKSCVVVAGFATRFVVMSPHTLVVHVMIMAIFVACEIIADTALVLFLEKRYGIPFSRVHRPENMKSREFWINELVLGLVLACACTSYYHAQGTAQAWFPDAAASVANSTRFY
jgi:hypothetical protein